MSHIISECPHCNFLVFLEIKDLNCRIYRHGVYKENYKQIDPHLNQEKCEELSNKNLIYGCGKPFKVISTNNDYYLVKCKYI